MSSISQPSTLWDATCERFKSRLNPDIFEMWFKPLSFSDATDETIRILAPNDFVSIWLKDNYLEVIHAEVAEVFGGPRKVIIEVEQNSAKNRQESNRVPKPSNPDSADRLQTDESASSKTTASLSGINPKNTFRNFVVGSGNQLAHAASIAVANAPARAYNPLFIYGDTGLGKTHLMHAIAHQVVSARPNAKIAYISTEKFTNKFITAIQENKLTTFRRRFRKADILLIDDIHFLSGRERIQEEFFHTFNELFENQKQIVLTSDRPASEIARLESRLVSRFQWGLVADIQCPDLDTRLAILSKKARSLEVKIPADVLGFLAEKVSRNVRRMEGALTRVAGYAALIRDPLSVEVVERLLSDVLQEELLNQVTIEKIQKKTADYYHLRVADLLSRRRPAKIVVPRQVSMYLSRQMTDHSLVQIGDAFGGRDHGTVINAIRAVENMMDQDPAMRRSIDYLTKQLSESRSS
ncbi:MAG: chromosomal replication initiator protein DnaA [Verrucomicrobiota bacterium]